MSDQKLAEQIAQKVGDGLYSEAMRAVALVWNERSTFGTRHCTIPGFTDVWVRYHLTGYPFGMRRKWDDATTLAERIELLLPHVAEWYLLDVNGQPVELPDGARSASLVDEIEDQVLMWLVHDFTLFWLTELILPRKNS